MSLPLVFVDVAAELEETTGLLQIVLVYRYGVPALGFAGPSLTGVHIAALVALAGGTRSRPVATWMTTGIAVWTIFFVIGSVLGLSATGAILPTAPLR